MTLSANALGPTRHGARDNRSVRRLDSPAEADDLFPGETGELRDACSLFMDVHGSTSHLQAVGDEEVQEAFGRLVEGIGPTVLGWGGYFADVAGDGALVLFTGVHGADHAVAAASAIQRYAIDVIGVDFARYTGRKFAIGIGLDRGDVRVRRLLPNKLSWLCLCTSTSAKLADEAPMGSFYATPKVLGSLARPAADTAVAWQFGFTTLKIGEVDRHVKIGTVGRGGAAGPPANVPAGRAADEPAARRDRDGERVA